jgi:hypothetical protein
VRMDQHRLLQSQRLDLADRWRSRVALRYLTYAASTLAAKVALFATSADAFRKRRTTQQPGATIMMNRTLIAAALSLACAGAFAQTSAASTTQRDVNQQTRIESGLQNGSLSTKEAGTLEKQESRIDHLQARDLQNGSLTNAERAQLNSAQSKVSGEINVDKHNAITGNPSSASSKRMQADVARNINQDKRIESGIKNGSLTNHEVSKLDRGQANVDRKEARAGANGHVSKGEQAGIQHAQNSQSGHIFNEKHNAQVRG